MTIGSASSIGQLATRSLVDALPAPYWTDRPEAPQKRAPLERRLVADLAIIGGGLTGLWAALLAREASPDAEIVLLEADAVASGASGRNGGFVAGSITHGLPHGVRNWPHEIEALLRVGRDNLASIVSFVEAHGIDADLRLCGKTTVATQAYQVAELQEQVSLYREYDEEVEMLDAAEVGADVASPTYLAGMRIRSNYGLVDPARLCWGLAQVASAKGIRIHEDSRVTQLRHDGDVVRIGTGTGSVEAGRAIVATSASPAPLRRIRPFIVPVYDHVLMTEPLDARQQAAVGWRERQGITDSGNFFHYYRPTEDSRILWGGYDAVYHFGSKVDARLEQNPESHLTLARHFFETFPQLEGLRFTHRWGGAIDSTSRFTPVFGTAFDGRLAYALGYTGLGVASSRFGAQVALDLVHGRDTELTRLRMVRRRPLPFPPEPLRWLAVRITQSELARQDRNGGKRSPWLRLLDRIGMGFAS